MDIFYLKINTNTEGAVECLYHWMDIVKAYGGDYFIVCDSHTLEERLRGNIARDKFIKSDPEARKILTGVVSFFWLNTGAALLTPFLHASSLGYENFFNIDADDTFMACKPEKAADILKKVKQEAENSDISCLSLDMHSSMHDHYYKHWSFGVTYTKLNADYIGEISRYNEKKSTLDALEMLRGNNLDELFTNLAYLNLIKLNVFNVENMYYAHVPHSIHVCQEGYWKLIKKSYNFRKDIPLRIKDEIKIPDTYLNIDVGLDAEESYSFLKGKTIIYEAVNNPYGQGKEFSLREEMAKTFELFRLNPDTPIYLYAGYQSFYNKMSEYGQRTGYFLLEDITGFIDSNPSKWGEKKWNIEIYPLDTVRKDSFIVVPTDLPHIEKQIVAQLKKEGFIHYYNFCLDYELEHILKRGLYNKTRKFQGLHQGERCFILGNGPSLSLDDIEKLKNNGETVLVSNNFSEWFSKTSFRPSYYFFADLSGVKKENEYLI